MELSPTARNLSPSPEPECPRSVFDKEVNVPWAAHLDVVGEHLVAAALTGHTARLWVGKHAAGLARAPRSS